MHKIKTLFSSRKHDHEIGTVAMPAATSRIAAHRSLIFPMIGTVFWFYA